MQSLIFSLLVENFRKKKLGRCRFRKKSLAFLGVWQKTSSLAINWNVNVHALLLMWRISDPFPPATLLRSKKKMSSQSSNSKLAAILSDAKLSKDARQSKLTGFLYESIYGFLKLLKHSISDKTTDPNLKQIRKIFGSKARTLKITALTPIASRTMLRTIVPLLLPWSLPLAPFLKAKDERILMFVESQIGQLLGSSNTDVKMDITTLWKTIPINQKVFFWQCVSDQIDAMYHLVLLDPNLYMTSKEKSTEFIVLQGKVAANDAKLFDILREYFIQQSEAVVQKWVAEQKPPSVSSPSLATTSSLSKPSVVAPAKVAPQQPIIAPGGPSADQSAPPTPNQKTTPTPATPPAPAAAATKSSTTGGGAAGAAPKKAKMGDQDLLQDMLKFMKSTMGEENPVVQSVVTKITNSMKTDEENKKNTGSTTTNTNNKSEGDFFNLQDLQALTGALDQTMRDLLKGEDEEDSDDEKDSDPNMDPSLREKLEAVRNEENRTSTEVNARIWDRFIGRPLAEPSPAVAKIEKEVEEQRQSNSEKTDLQDIAFLFNYKFVNQVLIEIKKVSTVTKKTAPQKSLFPELNAAIAAYEKCLVEKRNTTVLLKEISKFAKKNRRKIFDQAAFSEWISCNFNEHPQAVKLKIGKFWRLLGKMVKKDRNDQPITAQEIIWQALHVPIKICIIWHFLCSDSALLQISDVLNDVIVAAFKQQGASKKHLFSQIQQNFANDHRINQIKALVQRDDIRNNPKQFRRILRVFDLIINQDSFHRRNRLKHKNAASTTAGSTTPSTTTTTGNDSQSESEGEEDYDDLTSSDEESKAAAASATTKKTDEKKTTTTPTTSGSTASSSSAAMAAGTAAGQKSVNTKSSTPLTAREIARLKQIDGALPGPSVSSSASSAPPPSSVPK